MRKFIFVSCVCMVFLVAEVSLCDPLVSDVRGSLVDFEKLIIVGQGFGVKKNPAPRYYSNFENESVGTIPSGWLVSATGVSVSNSRANDGLKSLEASFTIKDDWSQIRRDLGEMSNLYFTANIFFEKNDECDGQWKAWRITSSPSAYSVSEEPTTTAIFNDYWFYRNPDRWGNNSTFISYDSEKKIGAVIVPESDLLLFNQWQRMEQFVKGSSAASVADGFMWTRRVGRQGDLQSANNIITYDADDTRWRYFMIGQAWGQHSNCDVGNSKVYYDHVYIDDTQARVEIGDAEIWANCTHREIQIPTSWSSDGTGIKIIVNQGSIPALTDKYLFVIDENGVASNGFPLPKPKFIDEFRPK